MKQVGINSNMASSDIQIDKPQRGHPKRAELPDVNINTGVQNINTERASLRNLKLWVDLELVLVTSSKTC